MPEIIILMIYKYICLSLTLSSLVGAIGRAGLRREVGMFRPGPRGPMVLRHQMVLWCAGGTEYPRWWHRQVGRQKFCSYFLLDKYAMFSFAVTSGLASVSDEFEIILSLRRTQKFWDTGPFKNFDFLFNPLVPEIIILLIYNYIYLSLALSSLVLLWRTLSPNGLYSIL